jgi:hypothetical protein
MTCPQCNHAVPAKSLWTRTGFSTVVCPYCHESLCPKPVTAVALFLISFGIADVVLLVLRRMGADRLLASAGFFVAFLVVGGLLAPLVLRLRLKGSGGAPHLTGHKA